MTWIRWETTAPRSEVVAFLADRLGLKVYAAHGLYAAMCCGFGDERPDGRIADVTDTAIEHWAGWDGKKGRFARAIRDWCAKVAEDGRDPGQLRGWWRNEAVLREQTRSARKPDGRKGKGGDPPRGIPEKSPRGSSGDSPGKPRGNEDDNENEDENGSSSLRSELQSSLIRPAVAVAVAANAGLRANPAVAGFNELLPQQAEAPVAAWLDTGIALALICETVEAVARRYKPGVKGHQPTSFEYFDKPVRQAHARQQGTNQLRAVVVVDATPRVPRIRRLV